MAGPLFTLILSAKVLKAVDFDGFGKSRLMTHSRSQAMSVWQVGKHLNGSREPTPVGGPARNGGKPVGPVGGSIGMFFFGFAAPGLPAPSPLPPGAGAKENPRGSRPGAQEVVYKNFESPK
jgi:hypothetical protein